MLKLTLYSGSRALFLLYLSLLGSEDRTIFGTPLINGLRLSGRTKNASWLKVVSADSKQHKNEFIALFV
jgi:hypothetical protein